MFKLRRLSDRPILEPIAEHAFEREAVFNCGVVLHEGKIHMLYRAADRDFSALLHPEPLEEYKFVSTLGYAVSEDGINFEREKEPVFVGEGEQEAWGVEDPRISKIGDTFYMIYTGFGGKRWDNHRISLATSKDLRTWERHGVLLDEPNKDGGLLEDKVDGKFMLFHRRMPHIWAAFSTDLRTWEGHRIVMEAIPGGWEEAKIGIAGQPFASLRDIYSSTTLWIATRFTPGAALWMGRTLQGGAAPARTYPRAGDALEKAGTSPTSYLAAPW